MPARPRGERKADALRKLETEVDVWVASASADGHANLVPLSYLWDGAALTLAMPATSLTARNLVRAGRARLALAATRDVVILEGAIEVLPIGADPELEDAHTRATGFDAREESATFIYIRVTPERIQAWREANELAGRTLMENGAWLV